MTLQKLTDAVAGRSGMTKTQSETAIGHVTGAIADLVGQNEVVRLRGFGTFQMKQRAERKGRNPQTGETITIAAHPAMTFKPHNGK